MDKALKQRLVGASVLILLAVIVLPMLLSGQTGSAQNSRRIEVPPKPAELASEARRFPIGDQGSGLPTGLDNRQEDVSEDLAADAVADIEEKDVAPVEMRGNPQEEPVRAANSAKSVAIQPVREQSDPQSDGRYLVQVASFSSAANANRLAERLRADGLPVLMDTVKNNAGRLHRVRVGPFDQQVQAGSAVAELKLRMPDLNPRVMDLRPDETAPVTEPSDPLVRWIVQAGSFAEEANAASMVKQLQDKGFTAYSEAVSDASGTSFKVRIGPVIERQAAVELAEKLKRVEAINGMVMSVD